MTTPVLLLPLLGNGAELLYVGWYGEPPEEEAPAGVLVAPLGVDETSHVVTPTGTEVVEVVAGQLVTDGAQDVRVISEVE